METKDYEIVLNSMSAIGVYVIREDDHQILYYNDRVKEVYPDIKKGMVCHEIWAGFCSNCPIIYLGDKKESKTVNYDHPFGRAVDITASRITWEEEIPALLITIVPHMEMVSHIYQKVLKANLTTDYYEVIKMGTEEQKWEEPGNSSLSENFKRFIDGGNVYGSDVERFRKFTSMEYLKSELRDGKDSLICTYRRRMEGRYRWHTMEIVPDVNYSDDSQAVIMYVKDVQDIYGKGLELEELNIANEEVVRSLGEINFGIYVVDLETGAVKPIRVSRDMEKMVGVGIMEWDGLLEKMVESYFHPEYQTEILKKCSLEALKESFVKGEKDELLCQRMLHGSYHYVSITSYYHEKNRKDRYVILALQDVDEYTRKELKHIESDKRLAAAIRSRYNVMNTVYLDTGICERVYLGYEDEPGTVRSGDYSFYIEKAAKEVVYEEDVDDFERMLSLENLKKQAENVVDFKEMTCQYRVKHDKVCWVEEQIVFVRQKDTVLVNILGRDITREKLKEESDNEIKMERGNIINSLSSMFFATYYIYLRTNTFRMVKQMDAVGEILGDEVNYMDGIRTYAEHFVHPDDRKEYLENLNYDHLLQILSKEHPFTAVEYRRIKEEKDGSYTVNGWIRATVVLAQSDENGPKTALYTAQDVTESKEKEEKEHMVLKEACEAANRANASKSEFLSRMSHDIRTPMNAIIGMTAIAGTHLENPERVADCLNKITVSSKHLLSLINEVLDMSKIESGKIELEEEEFNLSDLIQNLMTIVRPSIQEKNHELEMHIVNVEHEDVIGDAMRLSQVFVNILGNAIKYTPPGGRLELEIAEKPSKLYEYGCYEFIFKDNGIGMSEDFQRRIFEPFSRAEDSRVSKIEGTGLGMAIAMNIIHMMNGTITLESKLGEGSRFCVTVFLKQQNTDISCTKQFVNLPVLVADDDKYACEAACQILDELGMKSEWVLSGRAAVARVREAHEEKEDFFAVILDWKMPDMDGVETAREIRGKVGPDVPIIILSAYDWSRIEEEARRAGVDGFISKPLFRSKVVYLFKQLTGDDDNEKKEKGKELQGKGFEGKRILLAEDNELNREIAEEIIGNMGVLVESVENGKLAVERFEEMGEGYYDLIFMDIQMPVMNGYEAAKAIRKSRLKDAGQIPIIAMTANAFADDVMESKRAGMNEHIAKPLDIEHLIECMNRWL